MTSGGRSYDAQGHLDTGPGGVSYDYDKQGQLLSYTDGSGTPTSYRYDAFGRRVAVYHDGTLAEQLVYQDGLNPVAWVDHTGGTTDVAFFVYGTRRNVPEVMLRDSGANGTIDNSYYLAVDERGSVRAAIDASTGTVAAEIEYTAFGIPSGDTTFLPFGFAGGLYDRHSGLYRFGARDYNPGRGVAGLFAGAPAAVSAFARDGV